ncbi:MAG: recombinase family protein, partial [Rhodospirillaceae bacterium]|nr:recombinase family protein [Rhodospirillaceae bacterium]
MGYKKHEITNDLNEMDKDMTKHTGKYVTYKRVSTDRQGLSGLGLDAQQQAIDNYLNGGDWEIVGEFTEVESGR